jgi:hypothetical protein
MNLSTFFAEKDFTIKTYEVTSPTTGDTHIITTDVVIQKILSLRPGTEREQIRNILAELDFRNGDFHHFFKHLATGLAAQY